MGRRSGKDLGVDFESGLLKSLTVFGWQKLLLPVIIDYLFEILITG